VDPALASLLLDLTGLSDEEAEELTHQESIRFYLDRKTQRGMIGEHPTHDGQPVIFYEDRFDHAFYTSAYKASRQYHKGKFVRNRAARVRWIGEIIQGNIRGTECWKISRPARYHSVTSLAARLYVLWDENYLVWLEPLPMQRWWFSTAYVADRGRGYIHRILANGTCFWRKKLSRD
jgi:hypothetical protein